MLNKTITYLVLIILCIFTLFPLFWGLSSSLRSDTEIFKYAQPLSIYTFIPKNITFDAYINIFKEFNFLKPILNSLIVSFLAIIFGIMINAFAAFAFANFDFKYKKFLFAIIMVSFMVSFESIALPLYKVAKDFNMVDTFGGIFVPGVADGLVMFLFIQFFKGIPKSLIEAALIDGAKYRQIFFRVIIPLSIPVFITAGLMIFMTHWNSYLWPLIVARSPEKKMVQVALSDFQQQWTTLWSNLYAGSIVSALVPLIFFLPLQKYYVEGVTSSGVKG